ncbi:uncharacterized protein LOC109854629 [Pseudomyrmex gracilis]|uniref:uncharacterized protein LOC109854629 n=1 Tax=Pseudomyrmex gracilis TaxID=219809 RepID=UPI000995278D|nr:uncharacterized protein LOC109854629 [Pseudomyrmex gracilis]
MYEKISVIALVLLAVAPSDEISSDKGMKNANLVQNSRLSTIFPYALSRNDHRFANGDGQKNPPLLSVPLSEKTRTKRCGDTARKPVGAALSSTKRDLARAKTRNVTEIVAKRREAAKTRQDRTLLRALKSNLNAKDGIVKARLHETAEKCNTDKCICYCSEEDNFPDSSKKLGHRKKNKPDRSNYHKAEKHERPNILQQQKRPKLQHEQRTRDSILSSLMNHFPSYQEETIPNIHHHVSVPYKAQATPEIIGNLRSNGVPYHVPSYDGQNILLANSHGHYPHVHHNLYPWPIIPERSRIGNHVVSVTSHSPLNVDGGQTDDDYLGSYDQDDYFESYDQFEDYPESHDPVVASGKDEDPAELTTVAPNDGEDASVESKTNYPTEENGAVDFSSATETSEESVDRVKEVYESTDNLLDSAGEARVSMKKLTDRTTDRTTETARIRLLGKSKSNANKLLLIPNDENTDVVSRVEEEITEKVVDEEQTTEQQRKVVAASYDTIKDDSSTNRLPLCDSTLLLNSIRKAIDDFALDRTKDPDGTQDASLLPEILRVSNLKNILSKPEIENEIVERVKDILSASTSVSRRDFANDWSHSVIRNTLRSVVDTFHGIHQKFTPIGKHGTTDEIVSSPISDSEVSAVNPGNLMLNISEQVTNKIKDPTIRDRLNSVFQKMRDAANKETSRESAESDKEETLLRKTDDNWRMMKNKNANEMSDEKFDAKEHKNVKSKNYQKAKILKNDADTLSSYEYSKSLKNLSESVNLSEENLRIEEQIPNRVETKENIGDRVSDEMRETNAQDDKDKTLKSSIVYQQANSQSNHEVLTISAEQRLTENGDDDENVAATPENLTRDASLDRKQDEIISEDATNVEDKTESSASTTLFDNLVGNREDQDSSSAVTSSADHIEPLIILERIKNKEPPIKYYSRDSSEDATTYNPVTNDAYSVQLFPSSPASDDIAELQKSQLYYINDGVKFPLEIRQLNDGSYVLRFPEDICEHFLQKECPCCVPRTGRVIRSKIDQKETISTTTGKEDDYQENARANGNRVRKTMMRKTRNTLRAQNDYEIPISVTDFAERYNLLLDLDNKETLSQSRDETQSYDGQLLKNSVKESEYDQSEKKTFDNNRKLNNNLQKNEDKKIATGSSEERNLFPKRTILSEKETTMNKFSNIEEGNTKVFRRKKKREDEKTNERPFRYQRNASGVENKSAELVKSVLYWFKGLILDE